MTNLTLEQCQKLKEWELPQEDGEYNYFSSPIPLGCDESYETAKILEHKSGERDSQDHSATIPFRTYWQFICACPDLEQLLEFAKRECRKRFFVLALDDRSAGGWSADGGWIDNGEKLRFSNPDPKQAVYKLLEKIMGEAPHNKEKAQ